MFVVISELSQMVCAVINFSTSIQIFFKIGSEIITELAVMLLLMH